MDQNIEIIKNVLNVFFKNCNTYGYEIEVRPIESEHKLFVTINIPMTASLFIGRFGSNLDAFEIVLTDIANLNNLTGPIWRVEVDINGYRLNRQRELQDLAKKAAQRVMIFKAPVKLEPMTARDRKIIHNEISLYPDLTSASEGDNPNRCVVITYRN